MMTLQWKQGFYYDGDECVRCGDVTSLSEALQCEEKGILLSTLPLAEGFWRSSDNTTIIRECLYQSACKGGSEISESNDYCAKGYQGPCES